MKQGRVLRSVVVLLSAGAIGACQVVSGLASLDELDGAAVDPVVVEAGDGDARADGALRDGAGDGPFDSGADARDAALDAPAFEAGPSLSCVGLTANCGTYEDLDALVVGTPVSCCERREVPAGTTSRVFDYVDGGVVEAGAPATIAKMALDRFEVSVGRFKTFLTAYEAGWHPAVGAGRVLHGVGDPGWNHDAALKPGAALRAEVAACEESTLGFDPRLPINCITYAEAFAFCIFDGGRLPTEAEWAFAAVGGSELRLQPFSVPPSQVVFFFDLYQANATGPTPVGVHPLGEGKFGHGELLGNMAEWVRDAYVTPFPATACANCMIDVPDAAAPRSVRGTGFSFEIGAKLPRGTARDSLDPSSRLWDVGVRCAYDLP